MMNRTGRMDVIFFNQNLMKSSLLFVLCLYMCLILSTVSSAATVDNKNKALKCPPCNTRGCQTITTDNCDGQIMKDECGCCPVCRGDILQEGTRNSEKIEESSSDLSLFSPPEGDKVGSLMCENITCPKQQMCIRNIQGIPMCRCPTPFWCRGSERKELCGQDNKTYKNRCFLKVTECAQNKKIGMKLRGSCESHLRRAQKLQKKKINREIAQEQKEQIKEQKKANRKIIQQKKVNKQIRKSNKQNKEVSDNVNKRRKMKKRKQEKLNNKKRQNKHHAGGKRREKNFARF